MIQIQSIKLNTIYLIYLLKFTISNYNLLKHSKQKHKLLHTTQIKNNTKKQKTKIKQTKS